MGVQINGDTGNVIATKGTFSGDVGIGGTLTYEDVTNIDAVGIITARSGIEIGARPGVAASISVDGNAIFSGITTVGSKIDVTNDTHGNLNAVLARGSDPTFQLQTRNDQHSNDPQSGIATFGAFYSDNEIVALNFMRGTGASGAGSLGIMQAGEEKIRIDSNGYLGIGTASVNTPLHVHHSTVNGVALFESGDVYCSLVFQDSNSNDSSKPSFGVHGDDFRWVTHDGSSGGERMRLKNTGKLGINESSPLGMLHVKEGDSGVTSVDTSQDTLFLESNGNAGLTIATPNANTGYITFADPEDSNIGQIIYRHSDNSMSMFVNADEKLRIDTDGRLLVNSTAARNVGGSVSRLIQVESSGGGAGISIVRNQNSGSPPTLDLGKSRGYPHTIVQDDDKLGIINFAGADGTDLQTPAAQIVCEVDGTPGENDMPGRLVFKTNNGTTSSTERLQITSSGNIISNGGNTARIAWGTTGGVLYSGFSRYDGAAQDVGISHYATTNAGTSFVEHFRMEHNGTLKGTDTSIGSLSDIRLKKNIADYSYDISKFKQFKPKSFDWINPEVHGEKSNVKGFIAQDIETVDGDWVEDSWIKSSDPDFSLISDTTTTNGAGETVGVSKVSKFGYKDAMYISVIQQLISRIETLESS